MQDLNVVISLILKSYVRGATHMSEFSSQQDWSQNENRNVKDSQYFTNNESQQEVQGDEYVQCLGAYPRVAKDIETLEKWKVEGQQVRARIR